MRTSKQPEATMTCSKKVRLYTQERHRTKVRCASQRGLLEAPVWSSLYPSSSTSTLSNPRVQTSHISSFPSSHFKLTLSIPPNPFPQTLSTTQPLLALALSLSSQTTSHLFHTPPPARTHVSPPTHSQSFSTLPRPKSASVLALVRPQRPRRGAT